MYYFLLILFLLIIIMIINCVIMRIYSMSAKAKYKKKQSCADKSIKIVKKKKSIFSVFITYFSGLYTYTLRIAGMIPSFTLRKFIYKNIFMMKIGKGTKIRGFVEFIAPWNIEIGENTMIGQECKLDGRNGLLIGNNVNISDCVAIWTEQHDINDKNFACNEKGGKVTVGNRVWLGFRSVVLPNINIEEGVVLATGAIATKSCEKFSLYAGVPAKKIKDRNNNLEYDLDISYMHFI